MWPLKFYLITPDRFISVAHRYCPVHNLHKFSLFSFILLLLVPHIQGDAAVITPKGEQGI